MTKSDMIDLVSKLSHDIQVVLQEVRHIDLTKASSVSGCKEIPETILQISQGLHSAGYVAEAEALETVLDKVTASEAFGGLGLKSSSIPTTEQYQEILFLTRAWLKSVQYQSRSSSLPNPVASVAIRRPMTLAQKIFYQHAIGTLPPEGIVSGAVIRVGVDWVLASEISWASMARTHEQMGSPGIWRNDRLWLAGDHIVHPSILHVPKIKAYVETAEKAKKQFQMTEYQGMNYTIMHTEFVRERAEPGMLCIGSDSHTCSAGAVGCLSIGLGTADVTMGLSLGETWFKIPDSIRIELIGRPAFGISGKDVILHILKELKRNTVAAERVVEFDGEGLQYLSCDARFAIANMCTEFGAITGVFVPDKTTYAYINGRKTRRYKSNSLYFKPDVDAEYVNWYTIDLSLVEPSVAVYPNPDDVVPVSKMVGTPLDGVFIGACTTTEEELVLGALVLQAGLKKGLPLAKGRKHYVPGSLPIVETLRKLELLEIYEAAGFTRGPPGCSLCVGLSAEKAAVGETWLTSQNRNFENRMGPGSFGHLSSAAVCAASAFSMTVTSPLEFLKDIDVNFWNRYLKTSHSLLQTPVFMEPEQQKSAQSHFETSSSSVVSPALLKNDNIMIKSKVITLPDFIDTDALAPGEAITSCVSDEEFGQYVLKHTHPNFRQTVKEGCQVVVAGKAFGVGSSRECAVSALKGAGVQAVIARSFAFIYSRNQPSLGLLGFTISDEEFYQVAKDGADIEIDVEARKVMVGSDGMAECFKLYGKNIWEDLTRNHRDSGVDLSQSGHIKSPVVADKRLEW